MVGHNITPHSQIISQRGKTGKGNPKDDFKNTVINVFAPVRKSASLNFRAGNGKLNCFLRPAGVSLCKIKMRTFVMCHFKVTDAIIRGTVIQEIRVWCAYVMFMIIAYQESHLTTVEQGYIYVNNMCIW